MNEKSTELRFDIYERVNVPENLPAIGELEQIELIPHVRGTPEHDHMKLKGHLQLSAIYAAVNQTGNHTFDHFIPVEISLPVRAAGVSGEVEVQLEHFDVELHSTRSLNVTGVLSLNGWNVDPFEPVAVREAEEEIVAVHHAGHQSFVTPVIRDDQHPAEQVSGEISAESELYDQAAKQVWQHLYEPSFEEVKAEPVWQTMNDASLGEVSSQPVGQPMNEPSFGDITNPVWQPLNEPSFEEVNAEPAWQSINENESAVADAKSNWTDRIQTAEAVAPASELQSNDEKLELKVAFKPQAAVADVFTQIEDVQQAPSEKMNNKLEWRKLFFKGEGEERFQKMRMCIVQKEETITSIAAKYQLNPREIALYNRIGELDIAEGQILYIPSK